MGKSAADKEIMIEREDDQLALNNIKGLCACNLNIDFGFSKSKRIFYIF